MFDLCNNVGHVTSDQLEWSFFLVATVSCVFVVLVSFENVLIMIVIFQSLVCSGSFGLVTTVACLAFDFPKLFQVKNFGHICIDMYFLVIFYIKTMPLVFLQQ